MVDQNQKTVQSPVKPAEKKKPESILVAKHWLAASILLLIIASLWIGYEVYRTLTEAKIPEVTERHLQPLSAEIDRAVFDELRGQKRLKDKQLIEEARVGFTGGSMEEAESREEE